MEILRRIKKLPRLRLKWLKVSSFKDYCFSNREDNSYKILSYAKNTIVYPVNYVGESDVELEQCKGHELYMAVVKEAGVVGLSNVIIARNKLLYDLLSESGKYRITDSGLILKKICPVEKISPIRIRGGFFVVYFKYKKNINEAISLVGNYSSNLYHYIYEFMQKFYLIEKYGISDDVPVLVDSVVGKVPQFMEILDMMKGNRKVVFLNRIELCRVRKLYYPSFVHQIPPNFKDINTVRSEDVYFYSDGLKYLRSKFLASSDGYNMPQLYPDKIFVSRRVSKHRRYNESELIEVAKKYGFKVVYPEQMTIREQFSMFSHANYVIAASGAALSNVICCKPNCKILVLTSNNWNLTIFSNIAGHIGANMRYLCGKADNPSDIQTGFKIDIESFKKVISINK